jgi:hypothetical protein
MVARIEEEAVVVVCMYRMVVFVVLLHMSKHL